VGIVEAESVVFGKSKECNN